MEDWEEFLYRSILCPSLVASCKISSVLDPFNRYSVRRLSCPPKIHYPPTDVSFLINVSLIPIDQSVSNSSSSSSNRGAIVAIMSQLFIFPDEHLPSHFDSLLSIDLLRGEHDDDDV